MSKHLEQVKTFMTGMGQKVRSTPEIPTKDEWKLRLALLKEELAELEEALEANDLVEVADAYADLQYILDGGILQTGLGDKFEAIFDEVHRSNMSKFDADGKPVINGLNGALDETKPLGKVLKSELFREPNLAPILGIAENSYTHIAVLLDRSGSMSNVKEQVMTGFSNLIKEQKAVPGKATFSISQFDHEYDVLYNFNDINEIKDIEYIPRGSTALNDYLDKMIDEVSASIEALPAEERPERVIFHVITDGQDNASRISAEEVGKKVKQQESLGWRFIYTGANLDVQKESSSRGFRSAVNYSSTAQGTVDMFSFLSQTTANYRNMSSEDAKKFKVQADIVK